MRKILTLLLALTIAVGAGADVNSSNYFKSAKYQAAGQQANRWLKHHPKDQEARPTSDKASMTRQTNPVAKPKAFTGFTKDELAAQKEILSTAPYKAITVAKAPNRTPVVISTQPEGELVEYDHTLSLFSFSNQEVHSGTIKSYIVYAPDGQTVYIKNICGVYTPNAWVSGTINGNKITVPMDQYLYYDSYNNWSMQLVWGHTTKNESNTIVFVQDPTVTEVTFTIDGDNIYLDGSSAGNNGEGAVGLSIIDEGGLSYGLEWGSQYTVSEPVVIPDDPVIPDPITEQPEGEVKIYNRSGQCIKYANVNNYWTPGVYEQEGNVKIIYDPDGETVYIENPISGIYGHTTWARGTIQGGKIHVPLGQALLYIEDDNGEYYGLLEWGTAVAQENGYGFVQDTTVTEATFTINGDNIYLDNSSGGGVDGDGAVGIAVMYTIDHNYLEALDWNTEYTFITTLPTLIYDQPEGELVSYMYTCNYYDFYDNQVYPNSSVAHFVYAPDGETVYMQMYDGALWLTASITGNKIHMPLGQYTWYDEQNYYGDIFAWGTVATAPEGEEGAVFVHDNTVTEVTFTINDGVITMDNSSGGVDGIGAVGLAEISDDGKYPYYLEWAATLTPYVEPTVIYEQPVGNFVTYTRYVQGINYNEQEIADMDCNFNVVYAPDGQTAYIQDPVSVIPEGSWVMGTVNNNKITVPLRQYIFYDNGFGVITAWGTNTLGENGYQFTPDYSVASVTYTIDEDGYVTIDNSQAGMNGNGATGIALILDSGSQYFAMEWNAPVPEAITEQPEGQLERYVRHGHWIYESGSEVPLEGYLDIVFAPDKTTVYIKDPIYDSNNGTWVRGTLDSGVITVPLGQILSTEGKYNSVLAWGKMARNQDTWQYEFTPLNDKTAIQYILDGADFYMMDGWQDGPTYYGPAAMEEGSEYARGVEYDAYYTYYDGPMVIYDQPAGELVNYIRSGNGFYPDGVLNKKDGGNRYIDAPEIKEQYGEANVVFAPDGQTVYLQDPVFCGEQYNRGTWVRGTLSNNGTKIHVPLGQYVSWNLDSESGDMLAWGSTSLIDVEGNGNQEMGFMPDPDLAEVTYTIANGCISLDYSGGGSYQEFDDLLNQYYNGEIDYETLEQLAAPLFITSGLAYTDAEGNWTGESNWGTIYVSKHPATLPDPVVHNWYDAQNENGNSRVDVEIPTVDTDGMPIFEDALSYSIYTDNDQIFTFDASRYGLDRYVTEVTYDMWQDSWRLDPHAGIRFFRTNAEGYEPFFNWRIGIQFHYTVDGVKNSTNIVYLEVFEKPDEHTPGDVDCDGYVAIGDVSALIDMILSKDLMDSGDVDGDGVVSITDVSVLIDLLLRGGR